MQASLGRLGLEYVDLLFAHRPDPNVGMTEVVRAFNHVIDKGQALYCAHPFTALTPLVTDVLLPLVTDMLLPCSRPSASARHGFLSADMPWHQHMRVLHLCHM